MKKNFLSVFLAFWKYNKRLSLNLFMNYYLFKLWIIKNKKHKRPLLNKKIKKIIFLGGKTDSGLTDVKGTQPRDALRKKGITSESYIDRLPNDIDNSMIVFIKYFPFKEVLKAIKKNCVLVYEIMDIAKPFLWEIEGKLCDAIIFPNKRMQKDFKHYLSEKTKSFVIYHHWDPRLIKEKIKKQNKEFSLVYFGRRSEKNALFFDKLDIPVFTKFSDHLKYKNKFNCLYSMRKEGSYEFLYKPSTKVATAAIMGANIITSKEPSAVELLGENYPYLTSTDFDSVKKTIDYAKKTFGKKVWKDALKTMKRVRRKTDINHIVEEYIKIRDIFKND